MKVLSLYLLACAGLVSALPEQLEKRVCPHDNLLRCLIGTPSLAIPFCSSSVGIFPTAATAYTTFTPTESVTATSTDYSTVTSISTVQEVDTFTVLKTTSTTVTTVPTVTTVSTIYVRSTVEKRYSSTAIVTDGGGGGGGVYCVSSIPKLRFKGRAAVPTSLACIANLNPNLSAISSACSCFSGSYAPSIPPVTSTVNADPVTVTATTATTTIPVTIGETVTIVEWVTTTKTIVVTSTATPPCISAA